METTDSTQDLRREVKNPGCTLAHVRVQRTISAGNFRWFGYYQLDYIVASSPNVNLPLVLVFCIYMYLYMCFQSLEQSMQFFTI